MKVVKHYTHLKTFQINYNNVEQETNLAQFLNSFFDNLDEAYLREFLKDETKDYYPIYEVYYYIFKSISSSDKNFTYRDLKRHLLANLHFFTIDERGYIFNVLVNYCTSKIRYNENKETYTKELLSLYDIFLAKKYYVSSVSSYLPEVLFRNILRFALDSKKYKWAEKFVKVYSNKLPPSGIEDLKSYGYARLYIAKSNYAQALSYLYRTNYSSFNIKLEVKNMTLLAHYELGNHDMLKTEMNSYRNFIKNSKVLSKENKARYKNYIFYLDKYVKFINNRNKSYISSLKQKLQSESNIVYKEWLLEKCNELDRAYRRTA
jgi:hypothetical protein